MCRKDSKREIVYPLLALLVVGILVPGTARLAELIGTSPPGLVLKFVRSYYCVFLLMSGNMLFMEGNTNMKYAPLYRPYQPEEYATSGNYVYQDITDQFTNIAEPVEPKPATQEAR